MGVEFSIRLAGIPIGICCLHPQTRDFCADYLTQETAAFTVCCSAEDIEAEREKSRNEDLLEGIPVRHFSDSYLETLAIYRKIAEQLPFLDTLLFHGSVVAVDGQGYLFTAKSGTGKSTHTRLWRECFGHRARMINDDKPLLRVEAGGVLACGTPWNGKHHLGENARVPLKAICFLERGVDNCIEEISAQEAFSRMIQQCYRPKDPRILMQTLAVADRISQMVRFYSLHCNMEPEAAQIAYRKMNEA